ncbi:hypothetical protein GCM10022212_13760 [Actimicrobium antarcticum]|uniref:Type II toxin-antitoxin system HigB family toxin n=1 Tax=Actimicrobium antarcticum TaxID=1051899 RepID=A0ABP7T033_9BURK
MSVARWQTPQELKNQYRSAGVVGHNRIVFNIKGNDHRMLVATAYQFGAFDGKFIVTHIEYDRADAATITMGNEWNSSRFAWESSISGRWKWRAGTLTTNPFRIRRKETASKCC